MAFQARPRIGLDIHSAGGIYQGVRTHVLELFSRVIEAAPEIDFYAFSDSFDELTSFSNRFESPNVTHVPLPSGGPARRLLWDLPRLGRRHHLDLLHTQYIAPPFWKGRRAVTIHDVLFETHPEYFTRFFTLRSRILMRASAKSAQLVCTVSEYSRQMIHHLYGVPVEQIAVIANAASSMRFFPGHAGLDSIALRGHRSGAYFLSVGRLEPRKNHANLIRAYAQLPGSSPPLVIIGQEHFGVESLRSLAVSSGAGDRIHFMDDVADAELPDWYRHALCFVYLSWAEGFGMPVVEAFGSGVPVICSAGTALTEVAAGAAMIVEPNDVEGIARAMGRLAGEAELRRKYAALGLDRARKYSWDIAAATLCARYRDTLARPA